ncbi:MarR family winged helix-turn-helix transcriptional regulator [Brucella anthropi]|uniref:MarR family winged helix-turn-helix transcriptional regulator n=1 Tax=Brucella anthropi TaxID=529 RepID=UPI001F425801|nr:MarR family transcriptional regulator [Brucella anthropi]UVV69967.1 MarR family transcriptional regulator [Brucella anthropi]
MCDLPTNKGQRCSGQVNLGLKYRLSGAILIDCSATICTGRIMDLEFIVTEVDEGEKQELRLWLRMLATTRLVSQEIRRRLRNEFGVTLPQFDILAQLYREPDGLRLGELSRRTMVTNGNITGLIERLEADGLVRRETPGADRRVTVARLTDSGQTVFAEMARVHESWLRDLMAEVDRDTIASLLRDMKRVKKSVGNHLMDDNEE